MLRVSPQLTIPTDEFRFTFVRSPGPGGQNVNKVNSKAILTWSFLISPSLTEGIKRRFQQAYRNRINKLGEFSIASHRFRDQRKNVDDCLEKLRAMLAVVEHAPRRRRPTRKTLASNRRRLQEKKRRSETKQSRRRPKDDV